MPEYHFSHVIIGSGMTALRLFELLNARYNACVIGTHLFGGKARLEAVGTDGVETSMRDNTVVRRHIRYDNALAPVSKVERNSVKFGTIDFPQVEEDYAQLRLEMGFEDEMRPIGTNESSLLARCKSTFGNEFTQHGIFHFLQRRYGGMNPFKLDISELPLSHETVYKIDQEKLVAQVNESALFHSHYINDWVAKINEKEKYVELSSGTIVHYDYLISTVDIRHMFEIAPVKFGMLRTLRRRSVVINFDKKLSTRRTVRYLDNHNDFFEHITDGNQLFINRYYAPPMWGPPSYLNIKSDEWTAFGSNFSMAGIPEQDVAHVIRQISFTTKAIPQQWVMTDEQYSPLPLLGSRVHVAELKEALVKHDIYSVGTWGSFKEYDLLDCYEDVDNLNEVLEGHGDWNKYAFGF